VNDYQKQMKFKRFHGIYNNGTIRTYISMNKDGSLGRCHASMFATAMINKLCEDPNTGDPIDENEDDDESREQSEAYAALSAGVWKALLDVDRRGWEHEPKFKAKDDAWEEASQERTSIPLADFHAQWDKLQDSRTNLTLLAGDPSNRGSYVDQLFVMSMQQKKKKLCDNRAFLGHRVKRIARTKLPGMSIILENGDE